MKKTAVWLLGIVIGIIGITAILSGCSQGFTSGNSATPARTPSTAPAAQTTAQPAAPTTTPPTSTATPAAATGPSSKSSTAYPPKNFSPTVSGSTVSLSMAEVAQAGNGKFAVNDMSFMAYQMDGKYYIRASVCVPCGSKIFTLKNGTLICGSCGTVFNAATGAGMRGVSACMSYAKKAAVYTTDGGNIVMTLADLTTAYQNTLNRRN
ncbi:MAG: Fe-S-containing protein [Chloroflexota bacterium]